MGVSNSGNPGVTISGQTTVDSCHTPNSQCPQVQPYHSVCRREGEGEEERGRGGGREGEGKKGDKGGRGEGGGGVNGSLE